MKQVALFREVEEAAAGRFSLQNFVQYFDVLAEAEGGVDALRDLALRLAFQGRFTGAGELVPAVVREPHAPVASARGREATTQTIPGGAALAVGAAEMLIPKAWAWLPLLAVARLESGHTPSRSHPDYWSGGIPWIGIRDAKAHNFGWINDTEQTVSQKGIDNSSARLLPAGTVCLSRTASVGYVTIMGRPMATSQDFVNWVCGDRLLPAFLMNLLRCEGPMLRRFSKGAVHQTIYFPEVKAFHIALPPLSEQKRIVAKVDELMALLDNLEAKQAERGRVQVRLRAAALDALTSAEGMEGFGRAWERQTRNFGILFDRPDSVGELRRSVLALAVEGRLSSSRADLGVIDAELETISTVRAQHISRAPEPHFDRTLPTLANGWRWTSLDALLILLRNGVSTRPEGSSGVPVLRISAVRPNAVNMSEIRYLPGVSKDYDGYFVAEGDLLFTRYSGNVEYVGACGVVPSGSAHGIVHPDKLIRGQVVPDLVDARFVAIAMTTGASRGYVDLCGRTTAGQVGISGKQLRATPIPLPPLAEQHRIVAKVDQLMKLCDDLEAKLKRKEETAARLVEAVVKEIVAR